MATRCLGWLPLALAIPAIAVAQITPITVPKGQLRWDFMAQFDSWDYRWNNGTKEEDAADFNRSIMDRRFIPTLGPAEDLIRKITGRTDLTLSLGRSISSRIVTLGTTGFGGAFGLTKSITLHGLVPLVAVKVEPRVLIDSSGATATFNLASSTFGDGIGTAQANALLGSLRNALAALNTKIVAGDYDSDPALKALAQQTLAEAQALEVDLSALIQLDFAPRAGSTAATALAGVISQLQSVLSTQLSVTGFTGSLPLVASAWQYGDFEQYITSVDGPIVARPVDVPTLSYIGDIEVGAAIALIDRFPAASIGGGIRTVFDATVRLRTAQLERPDRFFDVGTGERQPDLDLSLTTDIVTGRLGARLSGGYNLQMAGNQNRRVTPPDQPIALSTTLAGVRRDPGDVIRGSAHPFFRIAQYLSIYGGVDFWTKQQDRFSYASGQPPVEGVELDVLGVGTKSSAVMISAGVSYSHAGLSKRSRLGLPMDASFRYQRIVRSGTGIVSDINTVRIDLRFYTRIFGGRSRQP